jgi:hypothetical protein
MKPRTAALASAISMSESDGRDLWSDPTPVNRSDAFSALRFCSSQLMIRLIDLGSKNWDLFRCFDAYLYCVTVDPSDFNMDRITDHDTLVYLSR